MRFGCLGWPGLAPCGALGGSPRCARAEPGLTHFWDPHPRLIPALGKVPALSCRAQVHHPCRTPALTFPTCWFLTPCMLPCPWRWQGKQGQSFLVFRWEFSLRFSFWRRGWEILFRTALLKMSHLKVQGLCGVWGLGSSSGLALLQLLSQPDPVPGLVHACMRQPQCCR